MTPMKSGIIIGIVIAIIGVFGYAFASGIFEFNQVKLEESFEKLPQDIQLTGDNVKDVATSTSKEISDALTNLPGSVQSITKTNREPVEVYDYCYSFIRIDLKFIETECSNQKSSFGSWGGYDEKFKFHLPSVIGQGFPNSRAVFNQESKLYQYDDNDFELGLFDQVGEKRYQVKLWELP